MLFFGKLCKHTIWIISNLNSPGALLTRISANDSTYGLSRTWLTKEYKSETHKDQSNIAK